ncbi:adenylate/guanylate cyclase domain-containing protein [Trichothermofontia sichuanensis B231]|uniref:adenylate/guanylate cyclase domain-containing protein n=1 Tax=Trichothermofontia sichuanensis TaxID=3045816 RepID=UPI002245344D|nr:adenylate/guanylate cyclase domain-containing protein [Trichothermofontia sichuanensis]UZQ53060.1 adenylate/guanylate cyclase domain-containing protein [Trichothermofontia sichuanensis B231]
MCSSFHVSPPPSSNPRQRRLVGSRWDAFSREFVSNSGYFLVLKSLADLSVEGWRYYLTHAPEYLLVFASVLQTAYLSQPRANRFWGNLIGVTLYTLLDLGHDGLGFFQDLSHQVFWITSLAIALCQEVRSRWAATTSSWLIPLESVIRALMLPAFYLVVRLGANATLSEVAQTATLPPTGKFLVSSIILIGWLLGLQMLQITRQQQELHQTAQTLKHLAEWGIGHYAVHKAVNDPEALALTLRDRSILFMDIREFTHWCEQQTPKQVAQLLNQYYQAVEPAAASQSPIRISITADEVMAIYATPEQALAAAQLMQQRAIQVLTPYRLGAGCAVHCGDVIEGLFGSDEARSYTVIGDVVNTAKRLEGCTPAGAITISDACYQRLHPRPLAQPLPPLQMKGKQQEVHAWQLQLLADDR